MFGYVLYGRCRPHFKGVCVARPSTWRRACLVSFVNGTLEQFALVVQDGGILRNCAVWFGSFGGFLYRVCCTFRRAFVLAFSMTCGCARWNKLAYGYYDDKMSPAFPPARKTIETFQQVGWVRFIITRRQENGCFRLDHAEPSWHTIHTHRGFPFSVCVCQ